MDRRAFLKAGALGAASAALAGCQDITQLFEKGEERLWGMNVHPYAGERIRAAQVAALAQLGIRRVRITLGLRDDLAGPYLRSYPAEYLGILGHYNDPYPDPRSWPELVRRAVARSPGVGWFEVLNEPMDMSARSYVETYLKPAYDVIKGISPALQVVAGAPSGTADGRLYFYQMTEAGADRFCDHRAVHDYTDSPEVYSQGAERPFVVSESGVDDPARHIDWWSTKMAHMSGVLETTRVYWYALAEDPDTGPALISSRSTADRIEVLSPLYDYIRAKYGPKRAR